MNKLTSGKPKKSPQGTTKCYRCLASHHPQSCPFIKYRCNNCSKIGHLQRACDPSCSKGKKNLFEKSQGQGRGYDRWRGGKNKNSPGGTHMVDNEGSNDYCEYIETVNLGSLYATNNNQTDKACKFL